MGIRLLTSREELTDQASDEISFTRPMLGYLAALFISFICIYTET